MRAASYEMMSSGDAREAILSRHDELREMVSETIHCVDGATTRQTDEDFEPLRAHARELYEAFEEHMDFEERILATALSDVIGSGATLRAQIEADHDRQRAALAVAMSALEPSALPPSLLIESVREQADTLLLGLNTEERCLLRADLDAIATDSQGG
jgi:hypothetical protein